MLKTILSGVFIFVLGQFVLKLVLDPIVSLRNVFGEISALFLREQRNIVNAQGQKKFKMKFGACRHLFWLIEKLSISINYFLFFCSCLMKRHF